jgi:hypothetical protein
MRVTDRIQLSTIKVLRAKVLLRGGSYLARGPSVDHEGSNLKLSQDWVEELDE